MQKFKIPHEINISYLTIPAFISKYLIHNFSSTFANEVPGLLEKLELIPALSDEKSPNVFQELSFNEYLDDNHGIYKLLVGCRIPFHVTHTFDEDYEVHFWKGMCSKSDSELCGYTTQENEKKRQKFMPDESFIVNQLDHIRAQLKLLNNDVDALMEVRNIHV